MSERLEEELLRLADGWRCSIPQGLRAHVASVAQKAADPFPLQMSATARSRASLLAVAAPLAAVMLLVVLPGARTAVARQVDRVLHALRISPHTELITTDVQTKQEVEASLRETARELTGGRKPAAHALPGQAAQAQGSARRWFVYTAYGSFGGAVREENYFDPERIDEPAVLMSRAPIALMAFGGTHRGEAVAFHHALLAPDGVVLSYFGAQSTELLLVQAPVAHGQQVAYSRVVSGRGGAVIGVAPAIETLTFDGQTVTWDPDTTGIMPNNSALRWEANGVSYSLYGRNLARDEAVALFSSLQPLK